MGIGQRRGGVGSCGDDDGVLNSGSTMMRRTLNRKLIEAQREAPRTRFPLDIELGWEAYLHLHCRAEDMGILGADDELHTLLDKRLAFFEEGGEREWGR